MSDILDNLSNYTNINYNIEALKSAQANSAAPSNRSGSADASNLTEAQSFLLQNEQKFNDMLSSLVSSSDDQDSESDSDPLSSLINSYSSSSTSQTLDSASLKQLEAMEKTSPLLGRTVSYYDSQSGQLKSGKISSISFTSSASAMLNLSNGDSINAGAVVSVGE